MDRCSIYCRQGGFHNAGIYRSGHGGEEPDAVSGDLLEKHLNLQITLELNTALRCNYLVDTVLTRTVDTTVSLYDRVRRANAACADLFVSVHVNAGGGTGFESFIHPQAPEKTRGIRRAIHTEAMSFLRIHSVTDRGMKTAGFYVLRATSMPAVLLETLFIDHPVDAQRLRDRVFIARYAHAVARGVGKALQLPARDPFRDAEKDALILVLETEVQRLQGEVDRLRGALRRIHNTALEVL
ncbi:N-acetylmuramoyl-L-alanine amidase [Candidatus Desulforudis audaxviator]|uniref:Cell wall hydrolase/autolysin n=1 Tax=Desulforudis audaxviator (strain MP104C) TaxID=477974 RepID=B1I5S1_DESAP|nr:N-acetylmuramoyl-L-alanine amidase [Candidatus Desulforudis audaxviator]ACA60362.1 cell wall hydrolase/autolysin [Candidatus Desulforudis audaxviator MP104C]AZK60417.1 cell wall hydrolase/autolysin [Candidatus Desulforudis audaxviator]